MRQRVFNFKKRRFKKPLLKRTFIFFGIAFLIFGVYNLITNFFIVKTIKVIGLEEKTLSGVEKLGDQNLLFLDKDKWEEEIEKENPILKEIEIEKEFPFQILIKIEKRKERAAIFNPNSSTVLLIDDEGVILRETDEEKSLPIIIAGLQNFKIGDRIKNNNVDFALGIILTLEESVLGSKFEIDETRKTLKLTLSQDTVILIGLEKEKEKIIYTLGVLAKKFKIEGKWPKKIDLRFEKPVLTF
ncbi:FtsQ-type POTRA domain-containing protein [Candidatus Microgenomates bacterium]|nr:FtsQ-type POTRA domain-containing protein [Candidatus Microgenomates bacterium]